MPWGKSALHEIWLAYFYKNQVEFLSSKVKNLKDIPNSKSMIGE